jgi:hypothetical protein
MLILDRLCICVQGGGGGGGGVCVGGCGVVGGGVGGGLGVGGGGGGWLRGWVGGGGWHWVHGGCQGELHLDNGLQVRRFMSRVGVEQLAGVGHCGQNDMCFVHLWSRGKNTPQNSCADSGGSEVRASPWRHRRCETMMC